MNIETRKLRLISEFIKIKNNSILDKIEAILKKESSSKSKISLTKFAGIWSQEEVSDMKKIIEEGCEQIYEEDW